MLKKSRAGEYLARECRDCALDKKAVNPVILRLPGGNIPAEWFFICSGLSTPHLKAIAESIEKGLKDRLGLAPFARDGRVGSQWIVLDYGSLLAHVMDEEARTYYALEQLWSDAARVE